MQIVITGPRGSGKTQIAHYLAQVLEEAGQDIQLISRVEPWGKIDPSHGMPFKAKICIIDSLEAEDEKAVRNRPPTQQKIDEIESHAELMRLRKLAGLGLW